MSITLTHPTAGAGGTPLAVTLPSDLIWVNEIGWKAVEQTGEYTSTGALVLDQWTRQSGQPMTLQGDVTYGWIQRDALQTVDAWSRQAALQLQLTRNGVARTVVFDHEAGAIQAEPVIPYSDPIDSDAYTLTLRFLILAP